MVKGVKEGLVKVNGAQQHFYPVCLSFIWFLQRLQAEVIVCGTNCAIGTSVSFSALFTLTTVLGWYHLGMTTGQSATT